MFVCFFYTVVNKCVLYLYHYHHYFAADESALAQETSAVFIWKGRHSNISGRDLSPALTNQFSAQVFITEGEEPACFLQLFQGGMVVYRQQPSRNTGQLIFNLLYPPFPIPHDAFGELSE